MGNACCRLGLTAVLVLAAGFAVPAVQAGVTIELVHQVGGISGSSVTRRTLFFQGDQRREEATVTFDNLGVRKLLKHEGRSNVLKQVIIDQVSKNLEFSFVPGKEMYYAYPLYNPAYQARKTLTPSASTRTEPPAAPRLRTIEVKYAVEPTGNIRIINGFKAREYRFIVQQEFEDRGTGQVSRVRNIETIWNSTDARVMVAYRDYMNYNRRVAKLWHTALSMDMIQQLPMIQMPFAFFGDHGPSGSDPLSRLPGFPVKISTSWEAECLSNCKPHNDATHAQHLDRTSANVAPDNRTGLHNSAQPTGTRSIPVEMPIMHTEILSITLGKLPGSLFAPPAGYTKKN